MKVVKFGGSSVATGAAVKQVIDIITADPARQIIVVSAPGKRHDGDIKVTDLLIRYAQQTIAGQNPDQTAQAIFDRYQAIGEYFDLPIEQLQIIHDILLNLPQKAYPDNEYLLAAFKAHGERLNAQLIAMIMNHLGIHAQFVDPSEAGIMVTGEPNNAIINPETYQNLANFKYDVRDRLIFPGFFGITPSGHIATFSRGGSDITGAILARGFHARLYENFTDVDAIFAANPKVIDHPQPIHMMTYREMRELSYAGFSVFHDEALLPAIQGQIPINVKNTHSPEKPGTMIVPEKGFQPENIVTGVASGKHFAALYLHKYLLNKEAGFTLQILEILDHYNVPYEHMPSGIDDISIIFDKQYLNDQLIDKICDEVRARVNPDRLEWIDDYAITMIVGEGMRQRIGAASYILKPLADANINIQMINQGASQISLMLGTKCADADKTVQIIYQQFFASYVKEA